jgi:hypothetical protein
MSVVEANGVLYLGAGGSDYLAKYDKMAGGSRAWRVDTSGSVQVVEMMEKQLVIGGHFWEVAKESSNQFDDNSAAACSCFRSRSYARS